MTSHAVRLAPLVAALLALAGCSSPSTVSDGGGSDAFSPPVDAAASDAPANDAPGEDAPAADAFTTDGGGTSQYTGAYISDDCGPADGAALDLLLFEVPVPADCSADPLSGSLRFYVHDLGGATLPPSAGSTITSTTAVSNGTATMCPGGTPPCLTSEDWTLTFTSYSDTGGASGTYDVRWGDGRTETGTFDATRCEPGPVVCG